MVITAVVCVLNEQNEVTYMMKMPWDTAISEYHGRKGYFITTEGGDIPYKVKRKKLKNIKYQSPS